MKSNRIGLKLGAVIVLLFLVVLLSLGIVIDRVFVTFYHAKMQEDLEELTAHFVSMARSHEAGTQQMIQTFADFSNVSIYILDLSTGERFNRSTLQVDDDRIILESDRIRLNQGGGIIRDFTASDGQSYLVSAQPILEESVAVYVLSSMSRMEASLYRLRGYLALSGGGAFLLALGFTFVVSQLLSRPMVQMEKATRRIAKGDLEVRVHVNSADEIGNLGTAINDLARDLQHYRDTRRELFANVSHELRTPITYLEGYAKVLLEGLYDTEVERVQYLTIIHQEAVRLEKLIHDLFELSKIEEGRIKLSLEKVDLKQLVENTVSKLQLRAKEKGLQLFVENNQTAFVYADQFRMEQILINILENAIRYTEEGTILISLHHGKDQCQLIVEDTGIGIPEEELPYLYERFYRVEKSRSREHGGTGLGLAIVKELVELQGGTVQIHSKPRSGTTIVITIPDFSNTRNTHSSM